MELLGAILPALISAGASAFGQQSANQGSLSNSLLQDSYNQGMYNVQLRDSRANTIQAQNYGQGILNQQNTFNAQQAIDNRNYQSAAFNAAQSFSSSEAEKARAFDAQSQDKQNAFNQMQSATAYQRSVADMKAAGLNPILAAGGVSSNATPSAGIASSPSPSASPPGGATASSGSGGSGSAAQTPGALSPGSYTAQNVFSGIGSALQASKLSSELQNMLKTNENIESNTNLTKQKKATEEKVTEKTENDAAVSAAQVYKVAADTQAAIANAKQATENAKQAAQRTKLLQMGGSTESPFSMLAAPLDSVGLAGTLNSTNSAVQAAGRSLRDRLNTLLQNAPAGFTRDGNSPNWAY